MHTAYLGFLLLLVVSSESGLTHHGHFCHCNPTFGQQAGSVACVELGGPGRRILPLIRNQIHCLIHPREWCASPTVVHAGKMFSFSPHGLPGLAPLLGPGIQIRVSRFCPSAQAGCVIIAISVQGYFKPAVCVFQARTLQAIAYSHVCGRQIVW